MSITPISGKNFDVFFWYPGILPKSLPRCPAIGGGHPGATRTQLLRTNVHGDWAAVDVGRVFATISKKGGDYIYYIIYVAHVHHMWVKFLLVPGPP